MRSVLKGKKMASFAQTGEAADQIIFGTSQTTPRAGAFLARLVHNSKQVRARDGFAREKRCNATPPIQILAPK